MTHERVICNFSRQPGQPHDDEEPNQEGFEIGRDRTRRLMKRLQLKVRQKRKYKITTDSKYDLPVAKNVLNREVSPSAPNQTWGTDIAYLWTRQEAIADVREYVAVYYNSKRLHSTRGYVTPMNYEKRFNKVSGIC